MKNNFTYLAFSFDHPQGEAVQVFQRRFGHAPQEVLIDPEETRGVRLLRVGPVEKEAEPQLVLNFDEVKS